MPTGKSNGFLVALVILVCVSAVVFAQRPPGPGPRPAPAPGPQQSPGAPEAGACACGFLTIFLVAGLVSVIGIALVVFLAIWVSKDAKARGMDNATMYVLFVIFFGLIGLIIYLVSRPQGHLYPCPDCGQSRLERSRRCPHCGSR